MGGERRNRMLVCGMRKLTVRNKVKRITNACKYSLEQRSGGMIGRSDDRRTCRREERDFC